MADCQAEAARRQSGVDVEPPAWLDASRTPGLRGVAGFSQDAVGALTGGPFAFLSYVVSGGSQADLERFSDVVPAYFMAGAQRLYLAEGKTLRQAAAELICGAAAVPAATSSTMWWHRDQLGVMVTARSPQRLDVCVVLDDHDPAAAGFEESWREWLRISNALIARSPQYETSIVTVKSVAQEMTRRAEQAAPERDDVVHPVVEVELSPEWEAALDGADDSLAGLVRELAAAGVPVPDTGQEIRGIPTELSWPSAKVVVLVGEQDGDAEELRGGGWALVPAECGAVVAAVRGNDA